MNKKKELEIELMTNKVLYHKNLQELEQKNNEIQAEYIELSMKYKKLLNDITSKDNQLYVYNGDIYIPTEITYNKSPNELDTLNITFTKTPKNTGLVNVLSDTYKNVANTFDKILYGTDKEN